MTTLQFINTDTFTIVTLDQMRVHEAFEEFNSQFPWPTDATSPVVDAILNDIVPLAPFERFWETNPPMCELWEIAEHSVSPIHVVDPIDGKYKRKWTIRWLTPTELEERNEYRRWEIREQRAARYQDETDPMIGQVLREEDITMQQYKDAVQQIKSELPYLPMIEFPEV